MKENLKIAVLGTGYWAQFQIAAWMDIGCKVTAAWNRTTSCAWTQQIALIYPMYTKP